MNFNRYFTASSYLLLATSFAMLAATQQVDAMSLLLFVCVLVAGVLIDSAQLRWSLSRRWANGLMIAYLGVAFFEWQILHSPPIPVIAHFILFATSLKLLRVKSNRDWLWLYVVSFCILLMSAGMMAGTSFLLLLVVYLFAAICGFVGFEIRRSQQIFAKEIRHQAKQIEVWREINDQRQPLPAPGSRSLLGFSATALISILLIAIPVFLVVPRVSRGAGRNSLLSTESLSGFSDTVRLGEVAQVKLNPQIVMRVRVKFPRDGERQMLRWRGVTLDQYDGQNWIQSGPDPTPVRAIGESFRVEDKFWPRGYTEQRFFMEPLDIRTVFVAPRPILLTGLPELSRDLGDGLWTEPHRFNKLDYGVYSDTSVPSDDDLKADNSRDYPASIQKRYLQLPPDHDLRITQLAAKITKGTATNIEIARQIEQHLRDEYGYTLNLHPVLEGDPVADFLFNTREGHCEYFASAMVLMLRSRQIPARIVNGFQTGEYNPTADVYTVRQSDAHSWVEAWFPKSGWIAFDPTPPAGLSSYDDGMMAWMRQYSEAMEMFWLEHVVGFDLNRQISIASAVQRWLAFYQRDISTQWFDWTSDLAQRVDNWRYERQHGSRQTETGLKSTSWRSALQHPATLVATLALSGLVIIGALILVRRKRGQSWHWRIRRDAGASAIKFYQEMLQTLERIGHQRESHQTPQEFAAQLALPAVNEITRLYQRTRFGGQTLTPDEATQVEALLRDLKRQSRKNWTSRFRLRSKYFV